MLQSIFFKKKKVLLYDFHHNVSKIVLKLEIVNHPGKKQINKNRRKIIKIQQLFTPFIPPFPFLLRFLSTRRKNILVNRAFFMPL